MTAITGRYLDLDPRRARDMYFAFLLNNLQ